MFIVLMYIDLQHRTISSLYLCSLKNTSIEQSPISNFESQFIKNSQLKGSDSYILMRYSPSLDSSLLATTQKLLILFSYLTYLILSKANGSLLKSNYYIYNFSWFILSVIQNASSGEYTIICFRLVLVSNASGCLFNSGYSLIHSHYSSFQLNVKTPFFDANRRMFSSQQVSNFTATELKKFPAC